ncbi:hypothetical protein NDA10_000159 [Ustilago hordei]|uniref:F-box domain-containing protein n=1 Tax=Ustilago hordei TaxID=120017 RepID=I2G5I5_USTHO|nr:uncharacterized protein UHO2_01832 [Ustilago hordei]KAJ1039302.1 hypothetical protein NDA10_000159 [Ustilago hordei]KAJ1586331.1 hypothetical protein NDA12_006963 [Ustilago hordei]KAJ1589321.1 hypothetical protein NDA15_004454 [Ustilago hordei]UTT93472.1 hypothetical protein NDA17_007367 [Ustilago hordei]CCF54428.1 uncharacterized protein UHOR_01860 [Ustilago hordei]
MSAVARLLKWAPCLWAISKLASNSGQAQRAQILNPHSGSHYPSIGTLDVLHSLSFTARTVVKHTHIPRASPALRRSQTEVDNVAPPVDRPRRRWFTLRLPSAFRHWNPQVYIGWQWEYPPYLPVRVGIHAVTKTSKIVRQAREAFVGIPVPVELEVAILKALINPARRPGARADVDVRLVCKAWNHILRPYFWQKRWLNIRPENATWASIGERLNALIRNADVITKVKMNARLTDIEPTPLERALQKCPELGELALCEIKGIKVGLLDSLNEILFKQLMHHHQERITHFGFRFDDTILFLGRRSLFADSNLFLPKVRKITIDISDTVEALMLEDRYGNSAGPLSSFVASLADNGGRKSQKTLEIRLFCQPRQLQIENHHIRLATQIFNSVMRVLDEAAGINLVFSFKGPLRAQQARKLYDIRNWAAENGISLLDIRGHQANRIVGQSGQEIAREVAYAQNRWSLY